MLLKINDAADSNKSSGTAGKPSGQQYFDYICVVGQVTQLYIELKYTEIYKKYISKWGRLRRERNKMALITTRTALNFIDFEKTIN